MTPISGIGHASSRAGSRDRPAGHPPDLAFAQTGEEFLNALVSASRRGRSETSLYASVMEVAKSSHVVSGEADEKDEQLRLVGARDMSDFEWLLFRGEIRFTPNPVIVFVSCGVVGKRDIEPNSTRRAWPRSAAAR
jgi:hypothetical protein